MLVIRYDQRELQKSDPADTLGVRRVKVHELLASQPFEYRMGNGGIVQPVTSRCD